jgi:diguanylate cyclase (GGDEF)-like protein
MDEKPNILIVDDDESTCRSLSLLLDKKGYDAETARTGCEALEKMKSKSFHVVLLDSKLPDMGGMDLLAPLKELCPDLSIIVVTGHACLETAVQAVNGGVEGYIIKPLDMDEVLTTVGEVLEKQRLATELRKFSLSDELTGLINRRGFMKLAEHQLKLANRAKSEMLLFFVDFDHLKSVNDSLSHYQGDLALIEIADVLKEIFRESDIIARIGGDEFVVLAIDAGGDSGENLLRRLQAKLATHNAKKERRYKLSISVGIAQYDPKCPCPIDELLHRADTLMYEQKKAKQVS